MAIDRQTFSVKFALLVISVGVITSTKAQWVIDDEGCRTPQRGVGSCVLIKQCQAMLDFIQQSAPLTQSTIQILQSYQCGFEGKSIKVCCPQGPFVIGKPKGPQPPPDVTKHKNLNLLPSECGLQNSKPRITGGNKTALFEFPWMALLSYETGNGPDFRCGGSLINDRYVLTAAHCLTNLKTLKLIGCRLGEYNITSIRDCEKEPFGEEYCAPPVQDSGIAEIIPHPRYNASSFTDDIGLIRLASTIDTSVESVKPICLPITAELRTKNFIGTKLTVTGWGSTETGRRSADLLKVDIPVTTEEKCRKAYEKSSAVINFRQLCAGGQNRSDSCGGDSGGPLQTSLFHNNDVRNVQYGVVSFGPRFCGQEGFPGVYTRTEYYLDWILDNLKP